MNIKEYELKSIKKNPKARSKSRNQLINTDMII